MTTAEDACPIPHVGEVSLFTPAGHGDALDYFKHLRENAPVHQDEQGIYILTRGGPGFKSMVPGLWMYLNAFEFQRMGYACAIGVMLFLLILMLTVLNLRYFRSSEQMTGN